MAQYTVLTDSDFADLLSQYDIGELLSSKVLSGGSENTNYKVKTKSGRFVVTICEQKTAETAGNLASLLTYLNESGFSTSKVVKTKEGELISMWQQKPVIAKEFLKGRILKDLPDHLLVSLGRNLANLHQISCPDYLPKAVAYGMERFDEVLNYEPNSSFYPWLRKVREMVEIHVSPDLPKALIHSDIFDNNIIVTKNGKKATIMDFEEACYYYRIFDIGMMLIGVCSTEEGLILNKASSLLQGYQQVSLLLETERAALQSFTAYAAAATAFWRHQNFRSLKPDPTMADHYLAMKKLADQVMDTSKEIFEEITHSVNRA